jgi:hypothetical protein
MVCWIPWDTSGPTAPFLRERANWFETNIVAPGRTIFRNRRMAPRTCHHTQPGLVDYKRRPCIHAEALFFYRFPDCPREPPA